MINHPKEAAAEREWLDGHIRDRAALLKANRKRTFLRKTGRPSIDDPSEAIAHVRRLSRRHAMSSRAIAESAGVCESVIWEFLNGHRTHWRNGENMPITHARSSTITKILSVKPQPIPRSGLGGARLNPTGTIRRIQALYAQGVPGPVLAAELGTVNQQVNRLALEKVKFVYAATMFRVAEVYEKFESLDPADLGFSKHQMGVAKGAARRNGYAPRWCWDDDTIDDPEAVAEWTGACGTRLGYAIHKREGIPTCEPCGQAEYARKSRYREVKDQ